jgi:flagellar biosynthesis protein FlhF
VQQVLRQNGNVETVLIDIPGLAPRDAAALNPWSDLLCTSAIETHLVVSATTWADELITTYRRFQALSPRRLIFSHLDEITSGGGLFSLAIHSQLPVSFLCTGPSVPEDLAPATVPTLLRLAWPERLAAGTAA